MITARTAGFTRDAKIKVKFLENTIATEKCLGQSERAYPLTSPLHSVLRDPTVPCIVRFMSGHSGERLSSTAGRGAWLSRRAEGAERLADRSESPGASRQR